MKRSTSQLRAISYSITRRRQAQAIADLADIGINFEKYKESTGWKGSPVLLVRLIREGRRS